MLSYFSTRDYIKTSHSITEVRFVCLGAQALDLYLRLLALAGTAGPSLET
jgi:hypothetical protein